MLMKRLSIAAFPVVVLLVLIYGGFIMYVSWPITLGNVDKAGVFGDSFGVLTALFSGLAFAGIVFTILLQREELQLQRQELRLTREEIKRQHNTMKRQNFESTFFQMLRLHNDIVNAIDLSRGGSGGTTVTSGRDCFVAFYKRINAAYTYEISRDPKDSEMRNIEAAYATYWKRVQSDLGHYFRYLYTIFKFIKASEIDDKRLYTNIVRAQLSDYELLVLFYNCLYKFGVEKFKPLAEEFAIFDNLPVELLIKSEHRDFYQPEAFGSSAV